MTARLSAALLAVALGNGPASAQLPPAITEGARLRVTVADSLRQAPFAPRALELRGTVARLGPDTLYLRVAGADATLAVPHARVQALALSLGVPSRLESAARHGATWVIPGAIWGALAADGDGVFTDSSLESAAIGAAIGFGVGALFGAISPSERWRRLRLRD